MANTLISAQPQMTIADRVRELEHQGLEFVQVDGVGAIQVGLAKDEAETRAKSFFVLLIKGRSREQILRLLRPDNPILLPRTASAARLLHVPNALTTWPLRMR